jgi:asparagine synthetase B (glutamine-hydrolysing)
MAKSVKVLKDNEFLVSETSTVTVNRYYDWQQLDMAPRDLKDEIRVCLEAIQVAILERQTNEDCQYALLSGGLDSRSIVAFLRSFGCEVQAATMAYPSRLDYRYAHDFARAVGAQLYDSIPETDKLLVSGAARERHLLFNASKPLRGHPVFSGDGGGETFGFLIMTSGIVELLQEGKVDDAIRQYSMESTLPFSILTEKAKALIRDQLFLTMKEEFDDMKALAPVKAFQLFLLRNDLRRHLHSYLDNIDKDSCELLLPFYDRRVIASVLRIAPPLHDYIRHAFYYKLLNLFPSSVMAVPWQAYPNSLPCPLPGGGDGLSQWEASAASSQEDSQRLMRAAIGATWQGDGIREVVLRHRVLGAAVLHSLRLRKYGYLFANYLAIREVYRLVEGR